MLSPRPVADDSDETLEISYDFSLDRDGVTTVSRGPCHSLYSNLVSDDCITGFDIMSSRPDPWFAFENVPLSKLWAYPSLLVFLFEYDRNLYAWPIFDRFLENIESKNQMLKQHDIITHNEK